MNNHCHGPSASGKPSRQAPVRVSKGVARQMNLAAAYHLPGLSGKSCALPVTLPEITAGDSAIAVESPTGAICSAGSAVARDPGVIWPGVDEVLVNNDAAHLARKPDDAGTGIVPAFAHLASVG